MVVNTSFQTSVVVSSLVSSNREVDETESKGTKLLLLLIGQILLLEHFSLQCQQPVVVVVHRELNVADILLDITDSGSQRLQGSLNRPKGL